MDINAPEGALNRTMDIRLSALASAHLSHQHKHAYLQFPGDCLPHALATLSLHLERYSPVSSAAYRKYSLERKLNCLVRRDTTESRGIFGEYGHRLGFKCLGAKSDGPPLWG